MTHQEQRIYLIKELLKEEPQYKSIHIPPDTEGQKNLLRSLMNVRPPRPISSEFLAIQDEYLTEETNRKDIIDGGKLPASQSNERIVLWKGDITTLKADAIVNAANSALRGCFSPCHSCIDNIIHSASGIQLRLICDEIMNAQGYDEPTGGAKITPAYNLPSRYILHTVGPIISGELTSRHCTQLVSCYQSCLALAAEHSLETLAFCCISTGVFCFPQQKAAEIALETVTEHLKKNAFPQKVIFNVFKQEDYDIYSRLLSNTR